MKIRRNLLVVMALPLVSCTVYNIPVNEFVQQIEIDNNRKSGRYK